jgi:hypothetical protein
MGCQLHSASHCERSPRRSRQHWSASSTPTRSESITYVVQPQFWRLRKGSRTSRRPTWLACAVERPWRTLSSGSIVVDWPRSRSPLAEDASRGTRPVIAPALSRLPSDHPTDVQTGPRRGH